MWKQEAHSHDSPTGTPTTTTWKEWQAQFGESTGFELRSAAASMTSSTQRGIDQASRDDIAGTIGITGREWREVFVPWLRNDAAYADSGDKDNGGVSSTMRPPGQHVQQRFIVAPAGMAVMLPFPQERYRQNTQTKKQPNVQSKQTNATCS